MNGLAPKCETESVIVWIVKLPGVTPGAFGFGSLACSSTRPPFPFRIRKGFASLTPIEVFTHRIRFRVPFGWPIPTLLTAL